MALVESRLDDEMRSSSIAMHRKAPGRPILAPNSSLVAVYRSGQGRAIDGIRLTNITPYWNMDIDIVEPEHRVDSMNQINQDKPPDDCSMWNAVSYTPNRSKSADENSKQEGNYC